MRYIAFLIFIFSAFALLSDPARADWRVVDSENSVLVEGECSGDTVLVELFRGKSDETSYTAGTSCENGHFSFSDDLLKWNLPEGEYRLAVNKDNRSIGIVSVVYPEIQTPVELAQASSQPPKDSPEQAIEKPQETQKTLEDAQREFGSNVVDLRESLVGMRVGLASSAYPETVKTSMESLMDLLDIALETVNGIFFKLESQDFDAPVGAAVDESEVSENSKPVSESIPVADSLAEPAS